MLLSELIRNLKDSKKKYGNLECVYSIDDEGNDFQPVIFSPTPMSKDEKGHHRSDDQKPKCICIN